MATSLKARVARAITVRATRKLLEATPVIGTFAALGLAGYEIKKKGLLPGALSVGADLIPVIGTAKNVIEIFTGDLIPDKNSKR